MEDIELVIKIPKELKEALDNATKEYAFNYIQVYNDTIYNALKNGTPLPKGHGVLKDVTNLMRGLYTDMQTIEETFTSSDVYKMIDKECPTIIEADKEQEDE